MNNENDGLDFEQMIKEMEDLGFTDRAIEAVLLAIIENDWEEDEPEEK